jgi:hypothetical protein
MYIWILASKDKIETGLNGMTRLYLLKLLKYAGVDLVLSTVQLMQFYMLYRLYQFMHVRHLKTMSSPFCASVLLITKGDHIDILYTLDSASNYSAIQKLKP